MNVIVEKSKLCGCVTPPASKSVAHRVLIASALCDEPTEVLGALQGDDVQATINALKALGAVFSEKDEDARVVFPAKQRHGEVTINVKESGSTLRFMLPIVCALGVTASFCGEGRIAERPISELLCALSEHGISVSDGALPLTVGGKLKAGDHVIDGTVSSQYVTGLLFALPLLDGDSTLELKGGAVSANYIDITLSVLEKFGISIDRAGNAFYVRGGQRYKSPKRVRVEGDFSGAAFFAVGGALCGEVALLGLNPNSLQGDKIVLELLKEMGADINICDDKIIVKESTLSAIEFCAENCPDLVPVMSVAMAGANGVSRILGVDRLRHKESDRLRGVIDMLANLGISAEYQNNSLKILGGALCGGVLSSQNDHRLSMSGAIAAAAAAGKTTILDAECVKKSYPAFFADLKKLGGKVDASEF